VICPVCGESNEPTRVYCRRCATELAPTTATTAPVLPEPPRARTVPPVAILGGVGGVVVLGALALFVLLPKGAPSPSDAGTLSAPPSAPASASLPPASVPPASPGGASVPPSTAPSAPPALTGLVVFSAVKNGDADLWIWDPASDSVHRLLKAPGDQLDPAWAPDGKTIVYRNPDGLRMVNVDGSPASPPDFTHHGQDRHPAWSPDGATVVFATDRGSLTSLDIATRPANDNKAKLVVLANSKADDWDPQWSPDGTEIVFASRRTGDAHLFIMRADGSHETQVPLGPGIYDDPMFSPDGQWLAFTRRDNAKANKALYVARTDGSEMRRLTHVDVPENDMAWSPDGRVIAVARAGATSEIVLIDVATGRELGSFGVDGAANRTPDWTRPSP
jgi:Tol biopolymer transport system component